MFAFSLRSFRLAALAAGITVAGSAVDAVQPTPPVLAALGQAPLAFEPVLDSSGRPMAYQARGLNYQLRIGPAEATLVLARRSAEASRTIAGIGAEEEPGSGVDDSQGVGLAASGRGEMPAPEPAELRVLRLAFPGANGQGKVSAANQLPGTLNYLVGKPSEWRTGLSLFARVRIENLYPGIDVVYYGNERRLEYDFVVHPGADPSTIRLRFKGADRVAVTGEGALSIKLDDREIIQHQPLVYQVRENRRVVVAGHYHVVDRDTVGFTLGAYEPALDLVIDPVLSYSTFFGGNSGDLAMAVKLDGSGNIYVAGQTLSTQFPFALPPGGLQTVFGGGKINGDAFIAKFNPAGTALVYFTYLGGRGNDGALDLAVDGGGSAYVAGFTDSDNFPATPNAYDTQIAGPVSKSKVYYTDAFVAKLNPEGNSLAFASYLGGENADVADALAIDPQGHAYIAGYTFSTLSFPVLNPVPGQDSYKGQRDAFAAKFTPDGTSLVYSTFLAGTQIDEAQGLAADSQGNAYVTGYTSSRDFPLANTSQTNLNSGAKVKKPQFVYDAFLTKIAPQGGATPFSTFLGGTNTDSGFRVVLDQANGVFVTGTTRSVDFPNTVSNLLNLKVGFSKNSAANFDAFVTRLSTEGELLWSSRFGGTKDDVGWDVATDVEGRVFVIGTTGHTNFPVANADGFTWSKKARGSTNSVFVTAIAGDGSSLLYSLPLSGRRNDRGYAIAVDPAGNAYIAGRTFSTNFPAVSPLQPALTGSGKTANDAFVAKISLEPTLATIASRDGLEVRWRAFSPEYRLQFSTNSTSDAAWSDAGATPAAEGGWHRRKLAPTEAGAFFRLRRDPE